MNKISPSNAPSAPEEFLQKFSALKSNGDHRAALDALEACLAIYPDNAEAHYNAVRLLRADAGLKMSPEDFSSVYVSHPLKKAYAARIQGLQGEGRVEEALDYARELCAIDPSNAECWIVAGILCLGLKRPADAIDTFEKGLQIAPNDLHLRAYLLKSLYVSGFSSYDEKIRNWISVFLKEPQTVNIGLISRLWVSILVADPSFAALLEKGGQRDHAAFRTWLAAAAPRDLQILTDDYFLNGVRNCVIVHEFIEQVLVNLRRTILSLAVDGGNAPSWALPVSLALAEQSFLNEYVHDVSEDEVRQIRALADALARDKNPEPLKVAAFASYQSLHSLPALAKTLKKTAHPELARLVRQQVTEPETEQTLKKKMKSLGKISDVISQKVRSQYEDNPYPRWISFGRVPTNDDGMVFSEADRLRNLDILVAGCATGHYPIRVSMNYPYAWVTGLDLSLSSLAYGARKAQEIGAKNVEFIHGDILEAGKLKRQFDIIFSIGVLHHMRDPEEGWRTLAGILKPGGLMKIGLYPERERRHITDGRAYIQHHNIPGTPEGIRQMRRIIKDLPGGHPLRKVMPFNDFYSTSMMRDLLFHVQEQCFTIPRIKKNLDDLGLEFLGWAILPDKARMQYRALFPGDPAMKNLENWDQYEEQNPDTFTGLYQFWCRKK